jgi:hypothetical protein
MHPGLGHLNGLFKSRLAPGRESVVDGDAGAAELFPPLLVLASLASAGVDDATVVVGDGALDCAGVVIGVENSEGATVEPDTLP